MLKKPRPKPPNAFGFPTALRPWAEAAVLATLYFLAGVVGLSVQTAYQGVSPIWPASGIAFASLFLFGLRLWPAIILGMLGLAWYADIPFSVALFAGLGSVLEAVIPVVILRRLGFNGDFNRLNHTLLFVAFAVILGPVFSATAGAGALALHQTLDIEVFIRLWAFWWLGNSIGILMLGSAILIWSRTPDKAVGNKVLTGLLLVCFTLIASYNSLSINTFPFSTLILFFLFPLIIYAAM
nr:MASE1 domain-containing protein [Gammaproteobacteria bacterium]